MSKLLIPNTTQVPNVLLDVVMRQISDAALRVLLAVVRKTYGFQKKCDAVSLTQLQKLTGMSRKAVVDGIKKLGSLLIINKRGGREGNVYELNLDTDNQLVTEGNQLPNATSNLEGETTSYRSKHTKPIKNKTNNSASKKRSRTTDPDPRVKEVIGAFVEKYTEVAGSRPNITAADAGSFKRLLQNGHDVPAIKAVMDRYFADDFYRGIGFDGPGFVKAFNRLNSAGAKKKHNFDEGAYPNP